MAAEQQIIVRLTAKCAEIMECAAYDWTTKEVRERPSDYLNDCLHYLETTFTALQILPVRQTLIYIHYKALDGRLFYCRRSW